MKLTQNLSDIIQNGVKWEALPKKSACCKKLWRSLELTTALFLSLVTSGNLVSAQITPDSTLGSESSTVQRNGASDQINGGAIRGINLFHSFLEFNVGDGQSAYFTNLPGIENIFSRVTGGRPSTISGTLGVLGNANLFLINPKGIIFGQGANLDLQGSFLATTASQINFADGTQFSTLPRQTPPILTISVPIGLGLGAMPGEIVVQGANLQVPPEKTLALVGGKVTLQGGSLIAPAGRIDLGSVAGSGSVSLTLTSSQGGAKGDFALGYPGVQKFQDIQLAQGISVDTSGEGGGEIQVQGRNVTLTDGSRIVSYTLGSQQGGNILVKASGSVQLTGSGTYVTDVVPFALGNFKPSELRNGIFTLSQGTGKAGDITINTRQLTATDGAFAASYTFGKGQAGDLNLNVSDAIKLSAAGFFTLAGINSKGKAGNLIVNTSRLVMQDNTIIGTTTFGEGQGGELEVFASNSIDLISGTPILLDNGITLQTAIVTNTIGEGKSGDALISTQWLRLRNGAAIQAATAGSGQGGSLVVNATKSVTLIGSALPVTQTGSPLNEPSPSSLDVSTRSSGDGGKLVVNTRNLVIKDGAEIFVESLDGASGKAGDLNVMAHSISLNRGTITAAAAGTEGGNIQLQAQNLQLRNQSAITATADNQGRGGKIQIDTGTLVALENSDITANAPDGTGGTIAINAQAIFGTQSRDFITPESDITAFGKTAELNGVVQINIPNINLQSALNQQEANFVTPEQAIASSCLARRNAQQGSFTVTGTGGLPVTPYDALQSQYAVTNVQPLGKERGTSSAPLSSPSRQASSPKSWKLGDPIQEAQGMTLSADGRLIVGTASQLVAAAQAKDLVCYSSAP